MESCLQRTLAGCLLAAMLTLPGCTRRAETPSVTTITWMVPVNWLRPVTEALVARFEAGNPDVRVRLMWVPGMQYQTKFKTLAAAGQAPDIVECGDVWIAYMLPFMRDLTAWVERDAGEVDLDDFYAEVLEACRHNGRYYFLASSMNLSLLYYNVDIFDRAGLAYPDDTWTWADFVEAGRRIMQLEGAGRRGVWGSDLVHGWWGEWLIYVRQAGGRLFNEDLSACLLDSPEAIRGLRMYYDKVHTHGISPRPGFGPSNGFASGQVGMLFGGHVSTWKTYNAMPGLDWDVAMLPAGPAGRAGGEIAVGAYGITRGSSHPEAAWRLLKFIVSPENIREQVRLGTLSVRRSVAEELLLVPGRTDRPRNMAAVYRQIQCARPIPRSPDYIEIALEIIQPEIDRMILGDLTPEVAARCATDAANRFLKVLGSRRQGEGS